MFRALDLRTGRVGWETNVSPDSLQYFFHGDPVIAGDIIVVGADRATGASVHAFHRSTGKQVWKHAAGRGVSGPVAGGGGRAYAATNEGQLLSLDIRSGALRWSIDLKVPGARIVDNQEFVGRARLRQE
jgi:outer membrane protein assembly factor BamB